MPSARKEPVIRITSQPPPKPKNDDLLTLRIPEELKQALTAAAIADDSSEARLVRLAIKDFLNKRVNGSPPKQV